MNKHARPVGGAVAVRDMSYHRRISWACIVSWFLSRLWKKQKQRCVDACCGCVSESVCVCCELWLVCDSVTAHSMHAHKQHHRIHRSPFFQSTQIHWIGYFGKPSLKYAFTKSSVSAAEISVFVWLKAPNAQKNVRLDKYPHSCGRGLSQVKSYDIWLTKTRH